MLNRKTQSTPSPTAPPPFSKLCISELISFYLDNQSVIYFLQILIYTCSQNAINAHRPEDVKSILDQHQRMRNAAGEKRHIVIFYCEFSSERGPRM